MLLNNQPLPGMTFIKYILVIFNFLFVVTGICLILVGWSINFIYFEYSAFLEEHYFCPGVLMIVIGTAVFFIASFGCWGAYRESTCAIMAFSMMLAVVFVLEVSAGVSAFVLQTNVHRLLERTMSRVLETAPDDQSSARVMDTLQSELRCCGVHSYTDWAGLYPDSNGTLTLPDSCCATFNHSSTSTATADCSQVYTVGCLPQLETFVRESIILLAGTASTIALIQFIGFLFSCSLAKMIRAQKTERERARMEMKEKLISSQVTGGWYLSVGRCNDGYENITSDYK